MNKRHNMLLALIFCAGIATVLAQEKPNYHAWWNDRYPGGLLETSHKKDLPLIAVKGNEFVDTQGHPVQFKGVSISDPDKIANQGQWNRHYFEVMNDWGIQLIRIPVHPVAWRERSPEGYLQLLDQAVQWCTELGMYLIIDWHSIGNLKTGLFQDPMYETTFS